jgi:formylglycine-generating enzyme required for sulfatase activity
MSDRLDSAFDFYFEKPVAQLLPDQANFAHGKGLKRTCKVGSYRPNRLGLYDMHGNVWEWCDDEVKDDKGAWKQRACRGGTFVFGAGLNRSSFTASSRFGDVGLRLARVPVGKEPAKTLTNSLGMEFVLVPKGKSWLGGGGNREVEIAHDFYLGKYEVTQEEWEKVTGLNPSAFKAVPGVAKEDQKRFPVESVSWEDCQAFIERLNKKVKETGWVYRLPKEAEWEYACRDGPLGDKLDSGFNFYFEKPTNQLLPEQAIFNQTGLKRTCKVGSYKPNRLGLYDMHGNVWEWCEDGVLQPKGVSLRVMRGGSWRRDSGDCQAAVFITSPPSDRTNELGLRLARVPIGKEIVKLAPAGPEPTRDRRAAEWVLSLGGAVSVHANGVDRDVRAGGQLPTEAFELRRIDLSNRALKDDDGLSHLAGLTNLVRIDLHNTTVTDAGLAHLKGLTNLRELYLFGCPAVSDAGVAHLKDLTSLRALDLNATRVTDAGLVHLKGLTNLTSLNLMSTRLSGAGFVHLKGLTKLEGFALAYSQVEDKGLAHVQCLSNVAWLSLEGTRVTDLGLVHLKGLTRLTSIFLSGPSVSAAGLIHLKRLPNLTGIDLMGAQVSDAWLEQLHGFSQLRNLYLRDTKVTAEGIAAFKKALPECRVHGDKLPGAFKNSLGMEFVLVPKGKAWLGGGGGKPGTKEVEIANDFYLGKYEVTQEEWQKVMRNNTNWFGRFGQGKDKVKDFSDEELKRFPVESVSWFDAQRFVEELNKLVKETGWVYRLPTQVEWEYACRGGPMTDKSDSAFSFYLEKPGTLWTSGQANVRDGKGHNRPCKVGSYKPNRLGLYDMHGNVWEWCQDELKDAKGAPQRAYRGGSWDNDGVASRAAFRDSNPPTFQTHNVGLRLARVPAGKETVASKLMEFVRVPKGTFYMGGGGGKPGRKTEIKEDFEMSVHLVTQGQWRAVMGADLSPACGFSRNGNYSDRVAAISDDDLKQFPVDNVSWHDTQAFIKKLNEKERGKGYLYRLPTDAEFEYACRGGASSPEECSFHFYAGKPSNDLSSREANFNGDNPAGKAPRGPYLERTTKVGSYPPNKLGLYDMHGNLWQWCQDAFAVSDPGRVMRGGGFMSSGFECRAGLRGRGVPGDKQHYCGFRVVRARVADKESN